MQVKNYERRKNSTTKAIEELNESNLQIIASELRNKNGVLSPYLSGPTSKIIASENKKPFPLYDVPVSDKWNDLIKSRGNNQL